jgi:hypothetical protein
MKKYILLFLIIGASSNAQNKLTFDYDIAGNQTNRDLLCINCIAVTADEIENTEETEESKEEEEKEESNPENPSEETIVSYYPNPVKEELFIEWREVSAENYVTTVALYSLSGQAIKTQAVSKGSDNLTLPFREYPAGVYIVLISYKNGDEKSIKIMKQ